MITFASEYCRQNCGVRQKKTIKGIIQKSRLVNVLDVCMIGAAPFVFLTDRAKRAPRGYKIYAASLKDVEKARTIKLLLGYSLAEGTEGLSGYATHPVVHDWTWQMQEHETRGDKCWLVAVIIGMAVPHSCEKEYWVTQQRLLAHADRFTGCSSGSTILMIYKDTWTRVWSYPNLLII